MELVPDPVNLADHSINSYWKKNRQRKEEQYFNVVLRLLNLLTFKPKLQRYIEFNRVKIVSRPQYFKKLNR